MRRHEHAGPHLCAVLGGGFLERERDGWRDVGAGSVRISGGARHDIDAGPAGARCLVLTGELVEGAPGVAALNRAAFLPADPWLGLVLGRLDRLVSTDDPARPVTLDGLLVELLAAVSRRLDGRPTPPPPWLLRVREQLNDLSGRITVAVLAREAGVHRVVLARAFRDHFGEPVSVTARRLRLETAVRLLAGTATPISHVAFHAGFADQAHLTRAVRGGLGVTPGALRRARLPLFKTPPSPVG